jgi:hypothetical protein
LDAVGKKPQTIPAFIRIRIRILIIILLFIIIIIVRVSRVIAIAIDHYIFPRSRL